MSEGVLKKQIVAIIADNHYALTHEFKTEEELIQPIIEETKKEFPMTDIDDSQGYGSAQDFLEDIWEWYVKWFGDGDTTG